LFYCSAFFQVFLSTITLKFFHVINGLALGIKAMKFSEYIQYDGLGLAKLVKDKEIHPSELLQVALERTHKTNPKLNAIIIPMYEQAKQRASNP